MLDELELLRGDEALQRLLGHYGEIGVAQPDAWQDRVMQMEGMEPKELVRLHGQLIAFGWVDQNTGQTPVLKPGVVACCYRATRDGLRALKQARGPRAAEDTEPARPEAAGAEGGTIVPPKKRRAKKVKQERPASVVETSPEAVPVEAVV
jgi:hypothetical protein